MEFFKNIRVLELASVLAGPSVGQFFAELGADVIKVENLAFGGDVTRSWKAAGENTDDRSAYFCAVNWGKRSIAIDLTSIEGKEQVQKLASGSDIVIVSYKPGDAEKFGVDYSSLSALNLRLIYGQITGYGPDVQRVGYDAIIQAEAGFMYMNGEPGGQSLKMPVALIDVLAAHHLKEGILLALLNLGQTGKGTLIAVSLLDAAVSSLVNQATNYLMSGKIPQKQGSAHPNIAPYGDAFQSRDGVDFILAVGSDKQFASLCQILNLGDLITHADFSSNAARVLHRDTLKTYIQASIGNFLIDEIMNKLLIHQIPGGIIKNLKDVFSSAEIQDLVMRSASLAGVKTFVGVSELFESIKLSPPPHLGEHTVEIIMEINGSSV